MSYATYTTEAIVCGSYARMTADKTFLLFTKDAGMLYATARSVREERSRQRYALQNFSLVRVSLVKGKSGWRIGSVEGIDNSFMQAVERPARAGVIRVVEHLRRYVRGEESVPAIFDDVVAALAAIRRGTAVNEVSRAERVFLFRLLAALGYVAPETALQSVLEAPFSKAVACSAATVAKLDTHIAAAELVSHL